MPPALPMVLERASRLPVSADVALAWHERPGAAADCDALQREYIESLECFAPFVVPLFFR